MAFTLSRTTVLIVMTLLAFRPLVARAKGENSADPSKRASVALVGPGHLVHSSEKHQRCEGSRLELFSCSLQSGGSAAVCLSAGDFHTTEFEFQDKEGHYLKKPFDNLEVGFELGNAHAYNMVLKGRSGSVVTTIFVSEGTYEGESGAMSRATNGNELTSYCTSENIYVPTLLVRDKNDHERLVDKYSLIDQGIAKRLVNIPDWPKMPDESLPQKAK